MINQCSISLLESALSGNIKESDEISLNCHLEECEACQAQLEQMAGGATWCRETTAFLVQDELDQALPIHDEWSVVDFTVEHLEPSDQSDVMGKLGGYDILEVIGRGAVSYTHLTLPTNREV